MLRDPRIQSDESFLCFPGVCGPHWGSPFQTLKGSQPFRRFKAQLDCLGVAKIITTFARKCSANWPLTGVRLMASPIMLDLVLLLLCGGTMVPEPESRLVGY